MIAAVLCVPRSVLGLGPGLRSVVRGSGKPSGRQQLGASWGREGFWGSRTGADQPGKAGAALAVGEGREGPVAQWGLGVEMCTVEKEGLKRG